MQFTSKLAGCIRSLFQTMVQPIEKGSVRVASRRLKRGSSSSRSQITAAKNIMLSRYSSLEEKQAASEQMTSVMNDFIRREKFLAAELIIAECKPRNLTTDFRLSVRPISVDGLQKYKEQMNNFLSEIIPVLASDRSIEGPLYLAEILSIGDEALERKSLEALQHLELKSNIPSDAREALGSRIMHYQHRVLNA